MNKYLYSCTLIVLVTSAILSAGCSNTMTMENKDTGNEKARRQRQLKNYTPTLKFNETAASRVLANGDYSRQAPVTAITNHKKYKVTLYSKTFPLPVQKIHSWIAHIEYANGKPVENATVYIHGGMPAHRHDFPVKPRVNQYLGKGNYLIEAVKFSMIGNWEMRIYIQEKTQRDRAIFKIKL